MGRKRNCPWVKTKKKPGPKPKEIKVIRDDVKVELAASDKGSWFGQQNHSDDESDVLPLEAERPNTEVGASRLKLTGFGGSAGPSNRLRVSDVEESSTTDQESDSEDEELYAGLSRQPETFAVVDRRSLEKELENAVCCRQCGTAGIEVLEDTRNGLGAKWLFRCKNPECSLYVDPPSVNTSPKNGRIYDINRAFVLAFRLIGRGHSAAEKFTSVMNLNKPVNRKPWTEYTKTLEEKQRYFLKKSWHVQL